MVPSYRAALPEKRRAGCYNQDTCLSERCGWNQKEDFIADAIVDVDGGTFVSGWY